MVYLPSDKAAWAILSELNMCLYTYTKMKQLNFLTKIGWNARTCKSCFWMSIIYYIVYARKNAFMYYGTVLGKGQSFSKKFSNVEMFKMKNNTIIVIWFLYL